MKKTAKDKKKPRTLSKSKTKSIVDGSRPNQELLHSMGMSSSKETRTWMIVNRWMRISNN